MAKTYLVAINSKLGTRKELTDFLSAVPEVTYWYACLPYCVFVTSESSANELFAKIDQQFKARVGRRIIITEVGVDRQGWLPKEAWRVLKNPDDPITPK